MSEPGLTLVSKSVALSTQKGRRTEWRLAVVLFAVAIASIIAGIVPLAMLAMLLACGTVGWSFVESAGFEPLGQAKVEVDNGVMSIRLGDRLETIDKAQIASAQLDEMDTVRLDLKGGRAWRIAVDDFLEGAAVLEKLGYTPRRVRRLKVKSGLDMAHPVAGCLVMLAVTAIGFVGTLALFGVVLALVLREFFSFELLSAATGVIAFALVVFYTALARPREALVGGDGVVIRPWFRKRFVPYANVKDLVLLTAGIQLDLFDGRTIKLVSRWANDAMWSAVERQIRSALLSSDRSERRGELDALERGGRDVDGWRKAVGDLVARHAGYRGKPIDIEDLVRIAEDANVSPERRVGAVLGVQANRDPALLHRVRIAASSCADDDMRAALEAAAEGDVAEDELLRATQKRKLD